jgi:drug/metabolite transporter (DMT)-like permease
MAIELTVSLWIVNRFGVAAGLAPPPWRRAALIGALMWAAYLLVLWALSIAPLAVIAPVREASIVAVACWGVWRLRERDGAAIKLSGAAAAFAGVVLLAA